jgi:integrase/recombinase XerD
MNRSKYRYPKALFESKLAGSMKVLQREGYSPSTIRACINYTCDFLFYLRKNLLSRDKATRTDMHGYISQCHVSGDSPKLINRKIAAVRKYYNYLQKQGIVTGNPADGLSLRALGKSIPTGMLTAGELELLYDSYQQTDLRTARNRVILSLLISQAVTTDDISRLEPGDINLRGGKIRLPGSGHEAGRTLSLEAHQVMELQEYLQRVRPEILESVKKKNLSPGRKAESPDLEKLSRQLFISMNGSGEMKNSLMHLVRALRQINPNVRSCSHIRQSVITRWLKRYDLRTVQYMAGHKRISSTERYQAGNLEDLQEAINKCHPLG